MAYLRDTSPIEDVFEVIYDAHPLLEIDEGVIVATLMNESITTVGDLRDSSESTVDALGLPVEVAYELKMFLPQEKLSTPTSRSSARRKSVSDRSNSSRESSSDLGGSKRSSRHHGKKKISNPKKESKEKGEKDRDDVPLVAGRRVRNLRFQLHSAEFKNALSTYGTFELASNVYISTTVFGSKTASYLKSHNFNNVKLEIYDVSKKKKSPKMIGLCSVAVSDLTENYEKDLTLSLYHPNKDMTPSSKTLDGASVRVNYFLLNRVLLPDKYYEPFVKVLTEPKFTLCVLLEKLVEETGSDVASYFVHVMTHHSQMHLYLENWIERELVRSEDTAVLFRGDSLGIKSFDVFLSWIGKDYLTETLGAHIMRIVSEDKRCELEEIKLEKTDKLRSNFDNFLAEATKITESIFSSDYDAPAEFCYLFGVLTGLVMEKFPYKLEVSVIAINGFLFLRFFVPALMSPQHHGLWEGHLPSGPGSTLNLLARVVQKLANMNLFDRDREPHLHLLNDFLRAQQREISLFVGKLAERKVRKDTLASMRRLPDPTLDITNELVELMNLFDAHRGWWEQRKEVPEVAKMLRVLRKIKALESRLAMQEATNIYSEDS